MNFNKETKCVVNTTTVSLWGMERESKPIEEVLKDAEERKAEDIRIYNSHIKNYPENKEMWQKRLEETLCTNNQIMKYGDYLELERKHCLDGELQQITEKEWEEHLNILPPIKWCTINGVTMFCMSEFLRGTYTTQYASYNGSYYCKTVDAFDEATWIYNLLKK